MTALATTLAIACGGNEGANLNKTLDAYKNSIVQIETSGGDGDGSGTGVAWENGQQLITNAHVVAGAASIKVDDPLEHGKQYPAVVVGLSACDDIAVLKVERAHFQPAKFGDSEKVQAGTHVVAIGYPGTVATSQNGSGLVVTEGIASRVGTGFRDSGQKELIQHTAPINPGNSGGPLLNGKGEVVGINSYSVRGAQAENYAIATEEALFIAGKLKAGKNLDDLGLQVVTNDADTAQSSNLPYTDGLAIMAVSGGGPANQAKPYPLKSGYTIGYLDGKFVQNVGAYCDILRSHKSGDVITVQFGAYATGGRPTQYETQITLR